MSSLAVQELMSLRDTAKKHKFMSQFCDWKYTKPVLGELGRVVIHNSELYGLDFAEIRSSGRERFQERLRFQYGYTSSSRIPSTLIDEIYDYRVPYGSTALDRINCSESRNTDSLEAIGITVDLWNAEVVDEVKKITSSALGKRISLVNAILSSPGASWYMKIIARVKTADAFLYRLAGCPIWDAIWRILLKENNTGRICLCLLSIPFRLLGIIIYLIASFFLNMMGQATGLILSLSTCYSCRIGIEQKAAALEKVMQTHPECDLSSIDFVVRSELEKLVLKLNRKFKTVLFVQTFEPKFTDGIYLSVFMPAHTTVYRSVLAYDKSKLSNGDVELLPAY